MTTTLEPQSELAELAETKREALTQANDILVALGRSRITTWPKTGKPRNVFSPTPLDIALNLPVYKNDDFWYVTLKSNEDCIDVSRAVPGCDVFDLRKQLVLTPHQAAAKLDNERYGQHERFAITLPEMLCIFLSEFMEGRYPELY